MRAPSPAPLTRSSSPQFPARSGGARRRGPRDARSFDETSSAGHASAAAAAAFSVVDLSSESRSSDVVIGQVDMFNHIFIDFLSKCEGAARKRFIGVLIEYIRSVGRSLMVPIDPLTNMLIDLLLKEKMYYSLHQLLQYHIIQDSESLAHDLLSIEAAYPPAYQLAIDMYARMKDFLKLSRLLLSRNKVLAALELMNSVKLSHTLQRFPKAKEYLSKASESEDDFVFYTTFTWFVRRNLALTNSPRFHPNEECEEFERKFVECIEVS